MLFPKFNDRSLFDPLGYAMLVGYAQSLDAFVGDQVFETVDVAKKTVKVHGFDEEILSDLTDEQLLRMCHIAGTHDYARRPALSFNEITWTLKRWLEAVELTEDQARDTYPAMYSADPSTQAARRRIVAALAAESFVSIRRLRVAREMNFGTFLNTSGNWHPSSGAVAGADQIDAANSDPREWLQEGARLTEADTVVMGRRVADAFAIHDGIAGRRPDNIDTNLMNYAALRAFFANFGVSRLFVSNAKKSDGTYLLDDFVWMGKTMGQVVQLGDSSFRTVDMAAARVRQLNVVSPKAEQEIQESEFKVGFKHDDIAEIIEMGVSCREDYQLARPNSGIVYQDVLAA